MSHRTARINEIIEQRPHALFRVNVALAVEGLFLFSTALHFSDRWYGVPIGLALIVACSMALAHVALYSAMYFARQFAYYVNVVFHVSAAVCLLGWAGSNTDQGSAKLLWLFVLFFYNPCSYVMTSDWELFDLQEQEAREAAEQRRVAARIARDVAADDEIEVDDGWDEQPGSRDDSGLK